MKYWIIFFLLLAMGITGCEDVLDVTPENSLTFRNGIETEKDLGAALDATALYMSCLLYTSLEKNKKRVVVK